MSSEQFLHSANDATRTYARQAILAVTTANSGAMLAALTQVETIARLSSEHQNNAGREAFLIWSAGLVSALVLWALAFGANQIHARNIVRGLTGPGPWENLLTGLGVLGFLISVAMFALGCIHLSEVFTVSQ